MLPGKNGDLWFSTGPTLQHIDRFLNVSSITMPSTYWQVGSLTRSAAGEIWFTLFNAGRIGVLRDGRVETFVLGSGERVYAEEIAADDHGSIWFEDDTGQLLEYRAGRIVRRIPVSERDTGSPSSPTPCGGRVWFAGVSGRIGYVAGNRTRQFTVRASGDSRYSDLSLTCGAGGRLWYGTDTSVGWFDRDLDHRAFVLERRHEGVIAAAPDGSLIAIKSDAAPYTLDRVFPDGKIVRHALPLRPDANYGGTYVSGLAIGADDTIWLSFDEPPSIVKLPPNNAK